MNVPANRPALRASRRCRPIGLPAEVLESRVLPAAPLVDAGETLDLVGRASDGTWWASSPHPDLPGVLEDRVVASWNPAADWRHVRSGDFDADGRDDVAGWDPASGYWWVSLSEPVGSTTLAGGRWSTATAWADVAVIDAAADGTGNDLVGRDRWGNWWAAVANGDGTFRNVSLTSWNPAADWRDVRYLDFDGDGRTDLVGRASDGSWWAALNQGGLTFGNVFLARWNEAAGWRDARVVRGFDDTYDHELGDFRDAVMARTADGAWWALSRRADGTVETRVIAAWNEAAGWRDVLAVNIIGPNSQPPGVGDSGEEVVARAANGDWYALDPRTALTTVVGHWNPAAGWRDVQAVTTFADIGFSIHNFSVQYVGSVIGRTADGEWWSSGYLSDSRLGRWNEAAGWRDVHAAADVGVPVDVAEVRRLVADPALHIDSSGTITIHAHDAGTAATVTDVSAGRVSIRYVVPPLGYDRTFVYAMPAAATQTVVFAGSAGGDAYVSRTSYRSLASGDAGDDLLDARNGHELDQLFGGPGLDVLLGDPGDAVVQD